MANDLPMPPVRLMNFVSEDQLDEAKKSRGERVEDGTAQRDRPLFEILKENKDKQDAEFNERFKHRPPKALDEDETEFLDRLEISRKEYERQIADEEAQQLRMFQVAVASQSSIIQDSIETPASESRDEKRVMEKKKHPPQPLGMIIKVKPPNKKAKVDPPMKQPSGAEVQTCSSPRKCSDGETGKEPLKSSDRNVENIHVVTKTGLGLVSYSDESDDDD